MNQALGRLLSVSLSPLARFGSKRLSYAEIALEEGKECLVQRLEELCLSPTILNSSRESTCAPGEDNDQPYNKRLQEDPEVDEEAIVIVDEVKGRLKRRSTSGSIRSKRGDVQKV